jgi:hypothetical protein
MGNLDVQVGFTVVPDGVRVDTAKGKTYVRLSVSVNPYLGDPASPYKVDLREWPTQVGALTKSLWVSVGGIDESASPPRIHDVRPLPSVASDANAAFFPDALALWKRIFGCPEMGDDGFASLWQAIQYKSVGPKPKDTASRFGAYQVAELEALSDALYGAALSATLRLKLQSHSPIPDGGVNGQTPDAVSAADMSYPSIGWWQDFSINALGAPTVPSAARRPVGRNARTREDKAHGAEAVETKVSTSEAATAAAARALYEGTSHAIEKDFALYNDEISQGSKRLYAAASALEGRAKDPNFWFAPRANLSPPSNPEYVALSAELRRFTRAWGLDGSPASVRVDDTTDTPIDYAGRAYAAILSYPTIAKYLGLIIDLEIELGDFLGGQDGTNVRGVVAAEPYGGNQPSPPDQLQWTAYTGRFKGDSYFGPASSPTPTSDGGSLPIRDGLLDLSAQWNSQARFVLVTLDTASHFNELNARGRNVLSASLGGLVEQRISNKLPNRRTRGINLVDRARDPQSLLQRVRKLQRAKTRAAAPDTQPNIFYAEKLCRGVRIDCALVARTTPIKPGARPDGSRWRPLYARNVSYPDPNVRKEFVNSMTSFTPRDDGHTRQMTGTSYVTQGDGSVVKQVSAHPELMSWPGESLAVPANGSLATGPTSGEAKNPFNVVLDVPAETKTHDRSPLPLRETRAYLVAGRAYYVNGCGLSFEDAVTRYLGKDSDLVLGSPDGSPYVYQRRHEIAAPEVCLMWNDRMVTDDISNLLGESIDTMVVRSGDIRTDTARRFLVPPRTSFDLAEQYGLFDSSTERRPAGAFTRTSPAQLSLKSGGLPIAIGGGNWADADDPKNSGRTSRGMVLVLDAGASSPNVQYYPDPMASSVCARFASGSGAVAGSSFLPTPFKFWDAGRSAVDTLPIVLEVKHLSGDGNGAAYRFDTNDQREGVWPMHSSSPTLCEKLSVAIAPAETVDLELWSFVDAQQCALHHQALSKALKLQPDLASLEWIQEALLQNPIGQITNHHAVKLVHAVDRPMTDPAFAPDKIRPGNGRIHPVVLTVAKDDAPTSPIHTWKEYVEAQEGGALDRMLWKSEPGGTRTFFVGESLVHRPSTGRLRCEAQWQEHGPENLRPKAKRKPGDYDQWDYVAPAGLAQLFSLETGDVNASVRDKAIDLVWPDTAGDPRGLSYTFPNMRARHLTMRLTATSRFTAYFPGESNTQAKLRETTGKGRYESASAEFDKSTYKVWVPCTFRPPIVQVDRIMPLFSFKETRTHDEVRWVREAKLQVTVDDSWYATGEGEMLGVACWPANLIDPDASAEAQADSEITRKVGLCDFDALDCVGYGTLVTRWGADPIHQSAPLEPLITADRFTGCVAKASGLMLRMVAPPDPSIPVPTPLPVSVVGYAPQLNKSEGRFYFDIGLDPGAAYYPFVQLGLVRFQPNSVDGFELSYSSPTWAQIPPRREGSVRFLPKDRVLLEVHGIGYHRSETGPDHDDERPSTDVPLLNVRVLKLIGPEVDSSPDAPFGWVPALDDQQKPIEFVHLQPIRKGAEVWWIHEIQLPGGFLSRYALQVEEVQLLAAGFLKDGAESSCSAPRFGTTLKERGPMFMHIIDLNH